MSFWFLVSRYYFSFFLFWTQLLLNVYYKVKKTNVSWEMNNYKEKWTLRKATSNSSETLKKKRKKKKIFSIQMHNWIYCSFHFSNEFSLIKIFPSGFQHFFFCIIQSIHLLRPSANNIFSMICFTLSVFTCCFTALNFWALNVTWCMMVTYLLLMS